VPTGHDLAAWSQAVIRREGIRRENRELALGFVSAASVLAGRGRSDAFGGATDLVAVGSLSALAVTAAGAANACGAPPLLPADHLLAGMISVPPGLFAKRWITLYTPDPKATGCLQRVQISYQLEDGRSESVLLTFRTSPVRSEWQAEACQRPRR